MKPVHRDVPAAVFSQPPIGTVGLSEARAREEHPEIDVYESRFRALKQTLTKGEEQTYVKLVVDKKSEFFMGGTELDFNDGLLDRGVVFKNPSATGTCGCGTSFSA